MNKYQFCVRFHNIDRNSAASKAVLDCNSVLTSQGYFDHTFTIGDNSNRFSYYLHLIKELFRFFISIKSDSLIAIQYPLLSINQIFKYFIKISRIRNVRFFCIVHDLESLRSGDENPKAIQREVDSLNAYDAIIIHNEVMENWLRSKGVNTEMVQLEIFDYLTNHNQSLCKQQISQKAIVFAGNLAKSEFIYKLGNVHDCRFHIYGPNFNRHSGRAIENVKYVGEYSPEEIPSRLSGKFGLLWDGTDIENCGSVFGNYLKYNSPHKCSLYLAAGIPVIAPRFSAAGKFLADHKVGILIDSLQELAELKMENLEYELMLARVAIVRSDIVVGGYLRMALKKVEALYE